MKVKHLKRNPSKLATLSLSIFLSATPLWANQVRCKSLHSSNSESVIERLKSTLAAVPQDDYGVTNEKWRSFESSIDSIFPTNENMHKFLWKFSQTAQRLKGVSLANPSQAAMQAIREGRPMPDSLKALNEIESSVLYFLTRLPDPSSPPPVLSQNYRALLLLANEATPQELEKLKAVFAAKSSENQNESNWSAQFMQALDSIQKRLGHRILQ